MYKTRVFVAGHKGMVGSAIIRLLRKNKHYEVITRSKEDLNLISQIDVSSFFKEVRIDQVIIAAAKVGGIDANNNYPADFIYENLMIQSNIIHSANLYGVEKLLFLGSSCIYPKFAEQPINESSLLTGKLEPTNEPYAIAKISGIKLCESFNRQYGRDYRSVMPTNLYGPNDNFHPKNSHVIPGLIRRFHEAKLGNHEQVVAWGSGKPMREFLHVDDMADACLHIMELDKSMYDKISQPMSSHINIGTGEDISIKDLVYNIADVVGFKGSILFDDSLPDGTPRKLMNVSKINSLGWKSKVALKDGLKNTYEWFIANQKNFRG